VVFSVDGAIEATHDAIRGPGQHRAVLEAVALAVAVGLPFGMTMTLHAGNVAELEALGFEAARLGARHVSFAMMQPTGTHLDARLGLPEARWGIVPSGGAAMKLIDQIGQAAAMRMMLAGELIDGAQRSVERPRADLHDADVFGLAEPRRLEVEHDVASTTCCARVPKEHRPRIIRCGTCWSGCSI
jgi:hypothetical protein